MNYLEETLTLIRDKAELLQNITPEDVVQDTEYVIQLGVEIEELIESCLNDREIIE